MRTVAGSRRVVATIQPIERIKTNAQRGTLPDINASCIYCLMERSTEFPAGQRCDVANNRRAKVSRAGYESKTIPNKIPESRRKSRLFILYTGDQLFSAAVPKTKSFTYVLSIWAPPASSVIAHEFTTQCVEDPSFDCGKKTRLSISVGNIFKTSG